MPQNVIVYVVIGLLVVGRFLVRELRERRYDVRRVYVLPAILGAIALALTVAAATTEPNALGSLVVACIVAIAIGAGIGYAVARFTTVRVTAEPAIIFSRGSFATVAIWIAALGLRVVARFALLRGGPAMRGDSLALNAALLVLLASALFFVRFRLLVAAKIERERGITSAISAV
jgi:uncharacterized membrane protein YjdF